MNYSFVEQTEQEQREGCLQDQTGQELAEKIRKDYYGLEFGLNFDLTQNWNEINYVGSIHK